MKNRGGHYCHADFSSPQAYFLPQKTAVDQHTQCSELPYCCHQVDGSLSTLTKNTRDFTSSCACCSNEFDMQFAAGTTCHGINMVCNSSWSWYRRGIWLLLVLFSLGLLATQLHDRWVTFLKFQLKTEVAIQSARNLTLPSVTLCNANFFSRASLTEFDIDLISNITYVISADIEEGISDLYKAGAFLPENWTLTYWQAAEAYEILEQQIMSRHNVTEGEFSVDSWLRRTGWQLDNSLRTNSPIIQCRVGKLPCSSEDFVPILTPQGLCYSLRNSPKGFVQKAPGGLAGINIFLDINQNDYTKYNLEGQSQFECGIKVILHEWYEHPDVGLAVGIPPGMSGFVAIKDAKRIIDATEPWSNCLETRNERQPYSEKQCLSECTAKQTLRDCGCRLWYEPGNATLCGVARTTVCLLFKELVGEDTSQAESKCKANCLEACKISLYSSSVSYTSLASNAVLADLTAELSAATNNSRFTEDYIRNNVIALQIAFAQLVVDRTTSTPALTLSAFLSDVGGQLGLFAGISMITICELLEYPFTKLWSLITGTNNQSDSLRSRRRRRRGNNNDNNIRCDQINDEYEFQHHQQGHSHFSCCTCHPVGDKTDSAPTLVSNNSG